MKQLHIWPENNVSAILLVESFHLPYGASYIDLAGIKIEKQAKILGQRTFVWVDTSNGHRKGQAQLPDPEPQPGFDGGIAEGNG